MPRLAIAKDLLDEYAKLEKNVQNALESAIGKFEEHPTPQAPGKIHSSRDDHIRVFRIDSFWRGVVLAPDSGVRYCLITVPGHAPCHARLWNYLRLGVPARPAECPLVFGGHDLGVAERAAELYAGGFAPLIVISGWSRTVPDGSEFATEADAIANVLLRRDVPKDAVALERLAANTSENFWLSAERLRDRGLDPQKILVVQKPYAERRTLARPGGGSQLNRCGHLPAIRLR